MSKTTAQSGTAAQKPAPTNEKKAITAKSETPKAKTVAELIQEQRQFFERKNEVLQKLSIFEDRAQTLNEALNEIAEEYQECPEDAFQQKPYDFVMVLKSNNSEVCKISTPVIIKSILNATLAEIEKNRKKLEKELLAK